MGALAVEITFYKENKDEILKKHKGRYVVIVGNKIVGTYNKKEDAVLETIKDYEMGSFLVQHVTEEERVATLSRVAK